MDFARRGRDRAAMTDTTPPATSRDLWYLGTLLHLRATGADTAGAYGLVEEHLYGGFATPRHVQTREDEAFLVMEGEMTFWRGDERLVAHAGDFVFLPRGIPHAFRVDSPRAHAFNLISPAGFEHFFADMGQPAAAPVMPPPPDGPPDVERMMGILADYGVEVLGPPPEPEH